MIKVGVIGIGSFGKKRVAAVKSSSNGELVGLADVDIQKAKTIGQDLGVQHYDVDSLLSNKEIDAVIIATPNKYHMPLSIRALKAGKHVLCEKPLARTSEEARKMVEAAKEADRFLKTGSNHRYFLSVQKAYEIVKKGLIGEIINFNGRIGNDGESFKNSWVWDKEISGGGTMLDNGCHLLDISRWFMGDFATATGITTNLYWEDCPVEDTGTGIFLTREGKMAVINTSWRQLSGYFYFEINGRDGYVTVDGRFDTHGGDNLYWMSLKENGKIHSINYAQTKPNSYIFELEDFFRNIEKGTEPKPSGKDGLEVVKMVEAVYKSNGNKIKI